MTHLILAAAESVARPESGERRGFAGADRVRLTRVLLLLEGPRGSMLNGSCSEEPAVK